MATYVQISDEIAQRLSTVDNIGRVYPFQRNIADAQKLKELCWDPQQERIATWWISREGWRDEQSSNIENTRSSVFVLIGVMAVEDDKQTELIFQKVCDDVATEFRAQTSLNSAVELTRPLQARLIGYSTFAGILCHTAQLTMEIQEFYTS